MREKVLALFVPNIRFLYKSTIVVYFTSLCEKIRLLKVVLPAKGLCFQKYVEALGGQAVRSETSDLFFFCTACLCM
jgi:hypothetical protein